VIKCCERLYKKGVAQPSHHLQERQTYLYPMPLKIGLTGGIGSGKTTVAKVFELLDVPVYYADAASKRLYQTDRELMQKMKEHFGEDIYHENELNRSKLAEIVFNNPDKLELLNSIVHPLTIRDAENWMATQKAPYVIKEAALLFESGSVSGLDFVIGVYAQQHVRLKRVMDRDKASRDDVLNRMKRQINEDIKMRLCDYVIVNNEQELVIPQVMELHEKFLQLSKASL
jgi:dephospho-CoA kinase